jgi:hypothetical protein
VVHLRVNSMNPKGAADVSLVALTQVLLPSSMNGVRDPPLIDRKELARSSQRWTLKSVTFAIFSKSEGRN